MEVEFLFVIISSLALGYTQTPTCWISSCPFPRVEAARIVTLITHLHLVLKLKKLWIYVSSRMSRHVVTCSISPIPFFTTRLFFEKLNSAVVMILLLDL